MVRRGALVVLVFALVAAACGGGDDDSGSNETVAIVEDGNGDGGDGSGSGSSDGDGNGSGSSDGSDGDGSDGDGGSDQPDDDDFGDIVGNPDLDADDLPGQAGDLADDIDDIVSIGDCAAVGLMATPAEDMQCRVLDQSIGGLDGFTAFNPGNTLNISIGSPSPLGSPCEILQACDEAEPIELSDNFPDTMIYEFAGLVSIWGNHANGAELVITSTQPLTDDDWQVIMDYLDSVKES